MDLINEQDSFFLLLQFLHHGFESFLEITAIARTGQQGAHVERPDDSLIQDLRGFTIDNLLGQAFGDRRLAHTGIADEDRIVLAATAEHFNAAVHFHVPADQRIDLAGARLVIQVHTVSVERLMTLLDRLFFRGLRTAWTGWARHARLLGHAMRDEIDRIITGHVLLLQEVGSVTFTFREDRDQHIRAGNFVAARALNVKDGALDNTLERSGRLNAAFAFIHCQAGKLFINVSAEVGAEGVNVDLAGAHHFAGMLIFRQRQKQMFQCGVFMITL